MEDVQFSNVFAERRKALLLTQEQIAQFVGVSKAAVSKWEKGVSYPDITTLPKLATYLNVSIDELLGYKPQMTNDHIRKKYAELAQSFSENGYEQTAEQIESLLTEYYACFPFVLKMAQLYVNYLTIALDQEKAKVRIIELCERVQQGATDIKLVQEAIAICASVYIIDQQPNKVLQLLGDSVELSLGTEQLIATAHTMLGQQEKAKEILQANMFQQLLNTIWSGIESLLLEVENAVHFEKIVYRVQALLELFKVSHLNPNVSLVFYTKAAFGYMMQGNTDLALQMFEHYVKCCKELTFPFAIQGDEYFYLLSAWIDREIALAGQLPRDEQSIKHDLVATFQQHPVFAPLHENEQFKILLSNLKHHLKMEEL